MKKQCFQDLPLGEEVYTVRVRNIWYMNIPMKSLKLKLRQRPEKLSITSTNISVLEY
jgi:hypothetical protein